MGRATQSSSKPIQNGSGNEKPMAAPEGAAFSLVRRLAVRPALTRFLNQVLNIQLKLLNPLKQFGYRPITLKNSLIELRILFLKIAKPYLEFLQIFIHVHTIPQRTKSMKRTGSMLEFLT